MTGLDSYDFSWMFARQVKRSPTSLICPLCRKAVAHFFRSVDESPGVYTVEFVEGVFVCKSCNVVLLEEMCGNAAMRNIDLIDRREKTEEEVDE